MIRLPSPGSFHSKAAVDTIWLTVWTDVFVPHLFPRSPLYGLLPAQTRLLKPFKLNTALLSCADEICYKAYQSNFHSAFQHLLKSLPSRLEL